MRVGLLLLAFAIISFSGCSVARDLTYIKQKMVGISNVETQQDVESKIRVKSKKRKVDGVKVQQNVIYADEIGYGSISKKERLKYSDKTDKEYGLFRYRFYYDYSTPDVILVLIDTDSNFYFESALDQSEVKFGFTHLWPENNLFNDYTTYAELYTIYLPFEYVEANKDNAIVIDLISSTDGHAKGFGTAFLKAENLSRTFHIPQFYIKGFLSAIDKYKPVQK
ncbi:hypothetical protein [Endomicrobium proavitum]|uniref:Lipoprotein n=1 Tax=Endomicrobium proavitum TaxID=1408281 RepID=A0A0G3WIQ2_9BACT|nr:hypothetical protein [Endomicrobium proavitum]AKL98193.1 exported protein of unknown function [Endomicrobium proavitum]